MIASRTSSQEVLRLLVTGMNRVGFLDVRSEGEYADGHIPGFQSSPILSDNERHAVGVCYKEHGQEAAIELGLKLTAGQSSVRAGRWLNANAATESLIVSCWRGGLRSRFASEWLAAENPVQEIRVVEGGYKAIRADLLKILETLPPMTIIAGSTGARKTELLQAAPDRALDLEACAHHRGSAFGGFDEVAQPAQATFENRVLLRLFEIQQEKGANSSRGILVEDESIMIGSCTIPLLIRDRMKTASTVVVEASAEERIDHLVEEYALAPLREGKPADRVLTKLRRDVLKLQKGLGNLRTMEVLRQMEEAFRENAIDPEGHRPWVRALLVDYYDRQYAKSLQKWDRNVIFRGNFQECEEWIKKNSSG